MSNGWYQDFPLILLAVEITRNFPSAEGSKRGQLPLDYAGMGARGVPVPACVVVGG